MKTRFSLGVLMMLLSGCSGYRHHFECPVDEGLACSSMSEVHKLMDAGAWPKRTPLTAPSSCKSCQKERWVEAVVMTENGPLRHLIVLKQG